MTLSIPSDINSLGRLEAARLYRSMGLIVLPCHGWESRPKNSPEKNSGKPPLISGWQHQILEAVTDAYLLKWWGNGADINIGCLVRPPLVIVDLDSKPDDGASVLAWLQTQPSLASVPRERTAGGVHLYFRCLDVPPSIIKKGKIDQALNDKVTAEINLDGKNVILAPSKHRSGHTYAFEVTGDVPFWTWSDLSALFELREPSNSTKKAGRPRKEMAWWALFTGDTRTLDLAKLFAESSTLVLGDCLEVDTHKHAVLCPWREAHGDGGSETISSATVIFSPSDAAPVFKCLHAHCAQRSLQDICELVQKQEPGLVDKCCRKKREIWTGPGGKSEDGRPQILLPAMGRELADFARGLGAIIAPHYNWFVKDKEVVVVQAVKHAGITFVEFSTVEAAYTRAAVQVFAQTGLLVKDDDTGDLQFVSLTMTADCACGTLASPQFHEALPYIQRILDVSIPVLTPGGTIVYPRRGYDPGLQIYTRLDAPQLRRMEVTSAKALLLETLEGFCFADEQSVTHALARFFAPYCRGLMGFSSRPPMWHYAANRPRAGKDYLAAIPQIVFEGHSSEDAPVGKDADEMSKRITAAQRSGRRSMHFANCQGYLDNADLIGAVTAKRRNTRNLGRNSGEDDLQLPIEIEFSFSANVGLKYRADIEPRTRRISLAFAEDDPNNRSFPKPDLHGWVLAHRAEILSAIATLVNLWIKAGSPPGPSNFASFPEFSRVVGGVMHFHGLGDPCLPHQIDAGLPEDSETAAMRALFGGMYETNPDKPVEKKVIYEWIRGSEDTSVFDYFGDLSETGNEKLKSNQSKVGKALHRYVGRELGGVVLGRIDAGRSERATFKFTKTPPAPKNPVGDFKASRGLALPKPAGDIGDMGDIATPTSYAKNNSRGGLNVSPPHINYSQGFASEKTSRVTDVTNTSIDEKPIRGREFSVHADFAGIAGAIKAAGVVALDIETFGQKKGDSLDPWRGEVRLLTLAVPGQDPWILDLTALGYALGGLQDALEGAEIIAHNAKFDLLWLGQKCGLRAKRVFCTLAAARLLAAGTKPGNGLDKSLKRYLGIRAGEDHSSSDWSGALTEEQLAYAVGDVVHLHALADKLRSELKAHQLERVARLEFNLIPIVVEMEGAGIGIDRTALEALQEKACKLAEERLAEVRRLFGLPLLNPGSHAQLKAALSAAGIEVESPAEEALRATGETRIIPSILALRSAEKQEQQAASLLKAIQRDGRIHGRFEPLGTATGRFSSKTPNLQNVGRGEIRGCFVPAPGCKLIVADYSQIELRVAAAIADEHKMLEAFRAGLDLHKRTAAAVLGKPQLTVSKEDRQLAKAVNFGLLYGQSAPGLRRYAASTYGVTIEQGEAERIREEFFKAYTNLRRWQNTAHAKAKRGASEVRTVLGRRRLIPSENSPWSKFTDLVNTPVQGGSADGIKAAILLLASRIPEGVRLVSTIHDELILEAPDAVAEAVCELVRSTMVEAMAALFPEVPIEVEASVCSNWGAK